MAAIYKLGYLKNCDVTALIKIGVHFLNRGFDFETSKGVHEKIQQHHINQMELMAKNMIVLKSSAELVSEELKRCAGSISKLKDPRVLIKRGVIPEHYKKHNNVKHRKL